jgi:hypothetical protein
MTEVMRWVWAYLLQDFMCFIITALG